MEIKTPTEFLTFNDGKCDLYSIKGNKLDVKQLTLNYGNRTVGMKRFYSARAATVRIDRLIQVPLLLSISSNNRIVLYGVEYKIEQVQHLYNTNPKATLLSLGKIGEAKIGEASL